MKLKLFSASCLFLVLVGFSAWAQAEKKFDQLQLSGLPDIASGPLNAESFAAFETRQLAEAKLEWINLEYFAEKGVQFPFPIYEDQATRTYSQQLKQWALDAWAYIAPAPHYDPKIFTSKTKTFYADRYGGGGGDGVGGDPDLLGSGRAASSGEFNIKGIGRTPLASSEDETVVSGRAPKGSIFKQIQHHFSAAHHLHGGASLREAMLEGIWGEILHRELPYGANRVIAIISMPMTIGHLREPRALIIRENSIRPAHFMHTPGLMNRDPQTEKVRIQDLVRNLIVHWGGDSAWNEGVLKRNLNSMVDRFAQTFATEFVHSIYHGATSPSNIEISGKALDHGPLTAVNGFSRLTYADLAGNGDTFSLWEELIAEFLQDLRKGLPPHLARWVPSDIDMRLRMQAAYDQQVDKELLWLVGFHAEAVTSVSHQKILKDFTLILKELILSGNDKYYSAKSGIPRRTGDYNLREILLKLHSNPRSPIVLHRVLAPLMKSEASRNRLIQSYILAYQVMESAAVSDGVSPVNFNRFCQLAAANRNRERTDLYRGPGLWIRKYWTIFQEKFLSRNRSMQVRDFIEKTINENTLKAKQEGPYQVLTAVRLDAETGEWAQRIYDAKNGSEFELRARLPTHSAPSRDPRGSIAGMGLMCSSLFR